MTVPVDLMTDTEGSVEATAWEQGTMTAGVLVRAISTGPTTTAVATPGMLPRRLLLAKATTASHLGAGMTTGKEEVYGPFTVLARSPSVSLSVSLPPLESRSSRSLCLCLAFCRFPLSRSLSPSLPEEVDDGSRKECNGMT